MTIEPWHIPVLVAAVIAILVELPFAWALKAWHGRVVLRRLRTVALALLTALALGGLMVMISAEGAAEIATIAGLVLTVVSIQLTYLSYRAQRGGDREARQERAQG